MAGAAGDLTIPNAVHMCMHGSTDLRRHAADDSLLAMLTSNKLQEIATPRSKDPLSSSAATIHSLSAKGGGLDWCASVSNLPQGLYVNEAQLRDTNFHDYAYL